MSFAHPLIFIRHGETPWNALGRYQGSTDTHLSNTGKSQAYNNAQLVLRLFESNKLSREKCQLVSSPLSRAHQTSKIIYSELNPKNPIAIDPRFRELSMGRWEGLTSQQVKDDFYQERKGRKSDRWNFKPVGGESMKERCPEITSALLSLKPHSIIVTHSVVLRIILHLLGRENQETAAQAVFPHEGVICWDGALLHRQ